MENTNLENKDPNGNIQNPRPRIQKSNSLSNMKLEQLRQDSARLTSKLKEMNGTINSKLFSQTRTFNKSRDDLDIMKTQQAISQYNTYDVGERKCYTYRAQSLPESPHKNTIKDVVSDLRSQVQILQQRIRQRSIVEEPEFSFSQPPTIHRPCRAQNDHEDIHRIIENHKIDQPIIEIFTKKLVEPQNTPIVPLLNIPKQDKAIRPIDIHLALDELLPKDENVKFQEEISQQQTETQMKNSRSRLVEQINGMLDSTESGAQASKHAQFVRNRSQELRKKTSNIQNLRRQSSSISREQHGKRICSTGEYRSSLNMPLKFS